MKKSLSKGVPADRVDADEILPEYDFKRSSPNKFASRYAAGSAVVVASRAFSEYPESAGRSPR